MTTRTGRIWVIGSLAVIGLGVIGWAVWSRWAPPSDPDVAGQDQWPTTAQPDASPAENRYTVGDGSPDAAAEALAAALDERSDPRINASERRKVAGAFRKVIAAYLSDSPDAFVDTLRQSGITPPNGYGEDERATDAAWAAVRKVFDNARFDPQSLRIVVGGVPSSPPSPGMSTRRAARPDGRPFLNDIPESRRDIREVTVDAVLTARNGVRFRCKLGFEMILNPKTGGWVLNGFNMYDFPVSTPVPGVPV